MEQQPEKKMCLRADVHLEEGLVAEVLARLPASSVLRFRAVCKEWLRIIDSPTFLADHARRRPLEVLVYTRSPVVGPDGLLTSAVDEEVDAVAATATRRPLARVRGSLDGGMSQYCPLLASCDGLLLFRNAVDGVQHYLVCNPATRRWSDLPRLSRDAVRPGCRVDQLESGFYFHEPSGEYRLLCRVTGSSYGSSDEVPSPCYFVFSTGADEPRRLSVQATVGCSKNLMAPAVLHGRLHWLRHMEAGLTDQMVAFDTVAETFRRMPPPPVARKEHSRLLVADGKLMVAELGDAFVDLWILEGYGGGAAEGTWERRHRVGDDVQWPISTRGPLLVAGGDGGDVVVATHNDVVAYNLKSRTVRQVVGGDLILPSRHVFRESLVRHGFFDARPYPGLPLFSFCT